MAASVASCLLTDAFDDTQLMTLAICPLVTPALKTNNIAILVLETVVDNVLGCGVGRKELTPSGLSRMTET